MHKKVLLLLTLLSFVAMFFACSSVPKESASSVPEIQKSTVIYADYPDYKSEKSLVNSSDIIIVGEVVKTNTIKEPEKFIFPDNMTDEQKKEAQESDAGKAIVTLSSIKITKVVKGNINVGDEVTLYQRGGTIDNEESIESDSKYFKNNDKAIFFLKKQIDSNRYYLLNPIKGYIQIINGKLEFHKENNLFKEKLNEKDIIDTVQSLK